MLRAPWCSPLDRLDEHRAAESAADADQGDAFFLPVLLQPSQQMQDHARAGGAHWMAEGDRPAVHIEFSNVERTESAFEAQLLLAILLVLPRGEAAEHLRGKGFVDFP